MKITLSILAAALLLSACGSAPRYQPYTAPTPVAQAQPEDNESGFSTEAEDLRADADIASAQQTYTALQGTTSAFRFGTGSCDDPAMGRALTSLQAVDDVAQHYLQLSTTAQLPADREAAMDVLDELNPVILDGLLDVAKAYRSRKCFAHAKHIMTETKRVYAGPAYASWVSAMDTEMAAIIAEQPVAPANPAKVLPAKRPMKKKTTTKTGQSS